MHGSEGGGTGSTGSSYPYHDNFAKMRITDDSDDSSKSSFPHKKASVSRMISLAP